jgi:hypothetical protein
VFQQHFWLFCGLWCGVVNSLFVWFRLHKRASVGGYTPAQANTFTLVLGAVVLLPMLGFWGLQQSAVNATNPNFLTWPSPQKPVALTLQLALWGAMLYWVFLKNGAQVLSAYLGAGETGWKHTWFFSERAFKVMAVGTVLWGIVSVVATVPAA